ncbi:MAG: hypothetical protein KDD04_05900, partial [Sinomicrobium sp.]|nr:hypothetical protein [Sinomicrobium sp.]
DRYDKQKELDRSQIEFVQQLGEQERSEAIAVADYLLETWQFTEEERKRMLEIRSQLVKEATEDELDQVRRVAYSLDGIFGDPMRQLVADVDAGTVKADKLFQNFLKGIKQRLINFLSDKFITKFFTSIASAIVPGGGFLAELFGAQEGAYIDKEQIIRVGENGTKEVIVPVNKLPDFIAGNYTLPGGKNINNLPGLRTPAPSLNMPAPMAPAGPGMYPATPAIIIPAAVNSARDNSFDLQSGMTGEFLQEMRKLREDVRVLQNPRTVVTGEDVKVVHDRFNRRVTG